MDTNIEVVPLSCAVQTYAWGKVGDQSTVAALAKNQAGFTFDQHMPYAEVGCCFYQLFLHLYSLYLFAHSLFIRDFLYLIKLSTSPSILFCCLSIFYLF